MERFLQTTNFATSASIIMADDLNSPEFAPRAGRGVTAATRQRLEALHAKAKACVERGDFDYAYDMLRQCVSEDPSSLAYAQSFRGYLTAKHAGSGKKSSVFGSLVTMSGRGGVAKHAGRGEWPQAFAAACQALKKNPVDLPVLREMAAGCGVLDHIEVQLFYLRWALDIDLNDVENNRAAAEALSVARQFEQAIACWQRVLKQKPTDEEARKAVSRLSVEQTLHEGGYDHELLKSEGASPDLPAVRVADLAAKDEPGKEQAASDPAAAAAKKTDEQLAEAIDEDPKDLASAAALAERLTKQERLDEALKLVRRSLKTSTDPDTPEHSKLEDLQLQIARGQRDAAQKLAQKDRSLETVKKAKKRVQQANRIELEVFAARVERSPSDTRSQFELGLRQKRAGQHREAIKAFQAARSDQRHAAEIQLHLGECFQFIDQFKLAASSYEAAVQAARSGDEETFKMALYRSGVLSMGLKDLDRAESRLTELAGLDFSYKDVGDRLDKIASLRKNT